MNCIPPGSPVHGFSRQEYWSGSSFPTPGNLLDSAIELTSPAAPALQADSLLLSHQGSPQKTHLILSTIKKEGLPQYSDGKNLPATQETWVRSPGWEDTLAKGMANHSSIFA